MTMLDVSTPHQSSILHRQEPCAVGRLPPGYESGNAFNMSLNEDLWETNGQVLKVDHVTVLTTDEDVRAA